jgi:hypothetical protein
MNSYKVAKAVSHTKGIIGSLKSKTLFLRNRTNNGMIPIKRAI